MSEETAVNFTKKALDSLPLPASGQRATYRDTKTPVLQVRVTAAGVKTYTVSAASTAGPSASPWGAIRT